MNWPGEWRFSKYSNGDNGISNTFVIEAALADQIKDLLDEKRLPWWWLDLTPVLREVVLDEVQYWDSHKPRRCNAFFFSSALRQNIDVLQALASISGKKCVVREDSYTRLDGTVGVAYKLGVKDHWYTRGENVTSSEIVHEGDVACLSVPSSFVLVRDNGRVLVCGQTANFGFPGGMSSDSFVGFAKSLHVKIDPVLSKKIHEQWKRTWPEMKRYFNLVGNIVGKTGEGTVVVERTGFVRGGLSFTQACNHFFQHLTATGAKDALWHVTRECYTDRKSPLWGCRPVMFVHDEIITELPEDRAAEAIERQAEIMIEVMSRWIPSIPIKAGPVLMRRWHKGAKAIRVDGRLVPSKPMDVDGKTKWVHDDVPKLAA